MCIWWHANNPKDQETENRITIPSRKLILQGNITIDYHCCYAIVT